MNFVDLFMSPTWREFSEYRGIQEAGAAARRAGFDASLSLDGVNRLAEEHRALQQELIRLQLMLATAFDALAKLGIIDEAALSREIDARLAAHRAAEQQAAQHTICCNCKQSVLKARTLATSSGPLCDRCSANQEA